jgi:hypothetical protein
LVFSVTLRPQRDSKPAVTSTFELPPWFGDVTRPAVRIAGRVFGAPGPIHVRIWVDAPDPDVWSGREVLTSATGTFDLGPMRAGPYMLVATGNGFLSRIVTVDTTSAAGDRVELFAHEWATIERGLRKFDDGQVMDLDWNRAHRLVAPPEHVLYPFPGPPIAGRVVRANGTPAAFVGIVPIAEPPGDHMWPYDLGVVATTDSDGRFVFFAPEPVCGFRILMGPTFHEVGTPSMWRGHVEPVLVRLPTSGNERHGVFNSQRRDRGDPRGGWIRGVVRGRSGPVPDDNVYAFVPPFDNLEIVDETRTRSDGTFELYISSRELDEVQAVVINGEVVALAPGGTRDDVVFEAGAAPRVRGVVVDEHGLPIAGVHVGEDEYRAGRSTVTGPDGTFDVSVPTHWRSRLRVFDANHNELSPMPGRLPPAIDIAHPDTVITGVRLVVDPHTVAEPGCCYGPGVGYVDLGAKLNHEIVRAVGDELEMAGLRVGDRIVAVDSGRRSLDPFMANIVLQGSRISLTIRRDEKRIVLYASAPRL